MSTSNPLTNTHHNDDTISANLDMPALHALHKQFTHLLSDFGKSSTDLFRILYTHPPPTPTSSSSTSSSSDSDPAQQTRRHCQTLFVLDSSFNPPSRAHLGVAKAAVLASFPRIPSTSSQQRQLDDRHHRRLKPRLLLLLATENADKAPKPAGFADRLVMMVLMARALRAQLLTARAKPSGSGSGSGTETETTSDGDDIRADVDIDIDVAVTKKPYFIDKAAAIDSSGIYGSPGDLGDPGDDSGGGGGQYSQIHLVGFDTLTRIFDAKYYPPDAGLGALAPFLAKHRLRATMRTGEDGKYGDREMQERWLEELADRERGKGFRREWLQRVEVVDDAKVDGTVEGVSSTRVREGVKRGDWGLVRELVGVEVAGWVRERGLYVD